MTAVEIISEFEKQEVSVEEFAYGDVGENTPNEDGKSVTMIENIGKMVEVDQHGGSDEGSNWYSIKFFPDHDIYLKVSGWYSSYNGTDFDGWESVKQVTPAKETVTVYKTL